MTKTWVRIAEFFETGDLVPFAVIISIYHYYKALEPAGDPVWVAIPVALFVDLVHFRTVRRACFQPKTTSIMVALLTTGMALGYHVLFYAQSGLANWHIGLYAAPIPLGMGILAWHAAARLVNGNGEAELVALTGRLRETEGRLREAEERLREAVSLRAFNPLAKDVLLLVAGEGGSSTAREIAERHGVSESAVSRLKGQVNGVKPGGGG